MKKIILFGLLILAFASCKKNSMSKIAAPLDTIKKTPPDTLVASADTMLVSAMMSDGNTSRFQYDSNNRLAQEIDSGFYVYSYSINSSVGNVTLTSTFGYDAQGNLIKREISDKYGDTVYNITYVNGQPTSATYIASLPGTTQPNITGTIKYTVTNNKVTEIDGSVYPQNLKVQLTYSGNNIASISVNGTNAAPLVNYSYGTNKSPFAASRFKWFLFPDCLPLTESNFFGQEYPVNMFNQNEVESLSVPSNSGISITFTNQYNALGYPTQVSSTKTIYNSAGSATYQYIK